jgi:hypothetical protein
VVEEVIRDWGHGSWQQEPSATKDSSPCAASFHETGSLKLDITKAASLLHWHPLLAVSEAIARTTQWYRERALDSGHFDAHGACVEQIQTYTARATEMGLPWTLPSAFRA